MVAIGDRSGHTGIPLHRRKRGPELQSHRRERGQNLDLNWPPRLQDLSPPGHRKGRKWEDAQSQDVCAPDKLGAELCPFKYTVSGAQPTHRSSNIAPSARMGLTHKGRSWGQELIALLAFKVSGFLSVPTS